jgi:PKD repeat protein
MKSLNKFILIVLFSFIGTYNVNAQCTSSFSFVDNGNGNYTFTSTSTGGINFYWYVDNNFLGIGNTVTQTFPNGTYTICLSIEDSAAGCFDTSCMTIVVTSGSSCTASYTYTNNGPGSFSFSNTSTGGLTYFWDFGDGSTSTLMNPNHIYPVNGNYYVCLIINDSNQACTDVFCDTIIITNINTGPCNIVAGFTATDNGAGNYSFTNTSTGNILAYYWNFGDGNTSTTVNPNHTYLANGTYVVTLTIGDSSCYDYYITTITVSGITNSLPCNAAFVIVPDSANTGNVIVYNTSTSSGGNLTYFWDFGDGNTSTLQYPNYTYTTAGPFQLCLIVTDNMCTSTYCDSINSGGTIWKQSGFTINVLAPTATIIEDEVALISSIKTYPNPVKNNLSIELNLTEQLPVEIYVTDLLGNRINSILNRTMNVGYNKLQWNTSKNSNGIYLLNIKTHNALQVKKVVLNR